MDEKELKRVAAHFFGITPTPKILDSMEVIYPEEIEGDVDTAKKIKIKWENHIGSESRVSRITPLDVMYYLGMKNTKENVKRATEILKGLAKVNDLPLVKVEDRYLLVNPKHRR